MATHDPPQEDVQRGSAFYHFTLSEVKKAAMQRAEQSTLRADACNVLCSARCLAA